MGDYRRTTAREVEFEANQTPAPTESVAVGSLAMHLEMEELFGLPKITRWDADELFGPYNVNGERRFWRFSAIENTWTVLVATADRAILSWGSDEASEQLLAAFTAAGECPPRNFPSNPNATAVRPPFVFEDWRFSWRFYPELMRWELAFNGRA